MDRANYYSSVWHKILFRIQSTEFSMAKNRNEWTVSVWYCTYVEVWTAHTRTVWNVMNIWVVGRQWKSRKCQLSSLQWIFNSYALRDLKFSFRQNQVHKIERKKNLNDSHGFKMNVLWKRNLREPPPCLLVTHDNEH